MKTSFDLIVYGGTSAAIIAAVQARQSGKSVLVLSPDRHLGGLSGGGLGFSDTGDKTTIGGLAREFYHRIWKHYAQDSAWNWQERSAFGNFGQGTTAIDDEMQTMWLFEPHVAESVFEDFVREYDISVLRDAWLDREGGVEVIDGRIRSIATLCGKRYQAKMFIDATYEGDLMAAAGVDYHVGRESKDTYGEEWAGVRTGVLHHRHHFGVLSQPVRPYVVESDPFSGVLPEISTENPGAYGGGDHRIQAYCFRVCMTNHPENRVPFPKPENYDANRYRLLERIFKAGWDEVFAKFDQLPNLKTDTNNHGPMSADFIGGNYDYPDASYARRQEIIQAHVEYQQGLYYYMANDSGVPSGIREKLNTYGLAADEFCDSGNWPHQLYIREARRMVGDYVLTENELLGRCPTEHSVGMGSYTLDSHNAQRYITPEGYVQNEGDIGVCMSGPYRIPYESLLPQKTQCENLLVPVCLSSSHMAFGSVRMEPVFMILAQSAACAAVLAIDDDLAVQEVAYESLCERLKDLGQVLEIDTPALTH